MELLPPHCKLTLHLFNADGDLIHYSDVTGDIIDYFWYINQEGELVPSSLLSHRTRSFTFTQQRALATMMMMMMEIEKKEV